MVERWSSDGRVMVERWSSDGRANGRLMVNWWSIFMRVSLNINNKHFMFNIVRALSFNACLKHINFMCVRVQWRSKH
eukprot:5009657-Lingulodinium_polyedra.AAC.1